MSLIGYLNELIDDSMDFPFYQQFNPLFNWISAPLSIGRSIFARARVPPGRRAPARARAQKMLRPIDKVVSLLNNSSNNGFNRR